MTLAPKSVAEPDKRVIAQTAQPVAVKSHHEIIESVLIEIDDEDGVHERGV